MSVFEKFVVGLLQAGTIVAPVFVHSGQGTLVLNASEEALAAILTALTSKTPPTGV
jgi:hypothetical protein